MSLLLSTSSGGGWARSLSPRHQLATHPWKRGPPVSTPSSRWVWKAPAATVPACPGGYGNTATVSSRSTAPTVRHAAVAASDVVDAEAAARAVQAGTATATPKSGDGAVEMIQALGVARRSAMKARTQAVNQLKALTVTAPDVLREHIRGLHRTDLIRTVTRWRPGAEPDTLTTVTNWPCSPSPTATCNSTTRSQSWTAICSGSSPGRHRNSWPSKDSVPRPSQPCSSLSATTQDAFAQSLPSPTSAASPRSPRPPARPAATASTAEATVRPTTPST
ncbi:hypothetical protein SAMN02787118_1444 [Streptomyces mirabilis]|uniref:Uncharacterized protein n=1 Tax=Streptomyces mirabilis TaxID=68239 RepID=A0A1I2X892_9ACTN|nr:hypothetical protein SAMN02787118_1444 [Streptomyces mirabilis]